MKMIKYEVTKSENGTEEWRVDGKLHREDGPAVKEADGTEYWYKNGKLHREDGPAVKLYNRKVEYWIEGIWLTKSQFVSLKKTREGKAVEIESVKYKLTKL